MPDFKKLSHPQQIQVMEERERQLGKLLVDRLMKLEDQQERIEQLEDRIKYLIIKLENILKED